MKQFEFENYLSDDSDDATLANLLHTIQKNENHEVIIMDASIPMHSQQQPNHEEKGGLMNTIGAAASTAASMVSLVSNVRQLFNNQEIARLQQQRADDQKEFEQKMAQMEQERIQEQQEYNHQLVNEREKVAKANQEAIQSQAATLESLEREVKTAKKIVKEKQKDKENKQKIFSQLDKEYKRQFKQMKEIPGDDKIVVKNDILCIQKVDNIKTINANDKVIVVVGETGNGKSTLCNRLSGDVSKKGDNGLFKVTELDACTMDPQCVFRYVKKKNNNNNNNNNNIGCRYAICDTPGLEHDDKRDKEFLNKIGEFAINCHHINAFFLVIKLDFRRVGPSKRVIKTFEKSCSTQMYKHCVVVVTGWDDANYDDNKKQERLLSDINTICIGSA